MIISSFKFSFRRCLLPLFLLSRFSVATMLPQSATITGEHANVLRSCGLAVCAARDESAAPVLDGEQCVLNRACSSCQTPSSKFLELFAQFQVLQALGSSSNPPKVPPAAPRIPPGLPKWVRLFHFGRPSVAIFRFLAHFLRSPKLIKI